MTTTDNPIIGSKTAIATTFGEFVLSSLPLTSEREVRPFREKRDFAAHPTRFECVTFAFRSEAPPCQWPNGRPAHLASGSGTACLRPSWRSIDNAVAFGRASRP